MAKINVKNGFGTDVEVDAEVASDLAQASTDAQDLSDVRSGVSAFN